jgi:putative Ca2+/H+ antiporter (TMEM165/GDT1 family)
MTAFVALAAAFTLVALGELGDKTQLLVVSLSARHSRLAVLGGAIVGEAVMAAVAVALGLVAVALLPGDAIVVASGAAFVAVGVWLLLNRRAKPIIENLQPRHVFLATGGLIAAGEMGDKTQLAIIALTTQYQAPWEVFIGAVVAEALMMAIAVALGDQLARRLKVHALKVISAAVFIVVGVLIFVDLLWGIW